MMLVMRNESHVTQDAKKCGQDEENVGGGIAANSLSKTALENFDFELSGSLK